MSKINLREALINLDINSDFEYHLTELYEACDLKKEDKKQLVKLVSNPDPDLAIVNNMLAEKSGMMKSLPSDDIEDEDMPEDIKVESYYPYNEDYLSDQIDLTMHYGKFLYEPWTDNHLVKPLSRGIYEVKHKVNGGKVLVKFDMSNPSDSTLKFDVNGKHFETRYFPEAQDFIISELEKKNFSQFDVDLDESKFINENHSTFTKKEFKNKLLDILADSPKDEYNRNMSFYVAGITIRPLKDKSAYIVTLLPVTDPHGNYRYVPMNDISHYVIDELSKQNIDCKFRRVGGNNRFTFSIPFELINEPSPVTESESVNEAVNDFKVGDKVFIKPSKKSGKVTKVKGDHITVEVDGGNDPDRTDVFYTSDLELQGNEDLEEAWWEPRYKEDEWEPEDIELHKNTDWAARNYMELPVPEDNFEHEVVAYGLPGGTQRKKVKFIKYIRPNEIYPPYYAPEEDAFEHTVGVMYDGAGKHGKYDIHNRYETQDVYDQLSEDTAVATRPSISYVLSKNMDKLTNCVTPNEFRDAIIKLVTDAEVDPKEIQKLQKALYSKKSVSALWSTIGTYMTGIKVSDGDNWKDTKNESKSIKEEIGDNYSNNIEYCPSCGEYLDGSDISDERDNSVRYTCYHCGNSFDRTKYYNESKSINESNQFRDDNGKVNASKWYASKYPDDSVGIEQLDGLYLDDLLKDRKGIDHCDTQVRDRMNQQLDKYIPIKNDDLHEDESSDDKPYSAAEIEAELKSLTRNFAVSKDTLRSGFEEENDIAIELLKKHYKNVTSEKHGRWFEISFSDPKKEINESYEYITSKSVTDSDGFMTDYTMYRDNDNDKFVFVFGDKEIYTPEDSEFDWECDSEDEAYEWFDSYEGLVESLEDGDVHLKLSGDMIEIPIEDNSEVGELVHPIQHGIGDPRRKRMNENSSKLNSKRLRKEYLLDVFDRDEIMELAMAYIDPKNDKQALSYILKNWDDYYFDDGYEEWLEEYYGDESLEESFEDIMNDPETKRKWAEYDERMRIKYEKEREMAKEAKRWPDDKELTYEEAQALARAYYAQGGDSFYETTDKRDFELEVQEFGPITVGNLKNQFSVFDSVYRDRMVEDGLKSKTFTDKEEAKKFAKDNKGAITSVVDDKLNWTHHVHYKGKKETVEEPKSITEKYLNEYQNPYAYYVNQNGLDKKIPVYIDEYEPGKFIWRDEIGESDDWFETKEMAYDNFVDFIKAELPNVVVDKYNEALNENAVSSKLPEELDAFLEEIAQAHGGFDYNDIIKFNPSKDDINKLHDLIAQYEEDITDEDESEAIAKEVANIVNKDSSNHPIEEKLIGYKITVRKDGETFDDYMCAYEEEGAIHQMKNKYGKDIEIINIDDSRVIKESDTHDEEDLEEGIFDSKAKKAEREEAFDKIQAEIGKDFYDIGNDMGNLLIGAIYNCLSTVKRGKDSNKAAVSGSNQLRGEVVHAAQRVLNSLIKELKKAESFDKPFNLLKFAAPKVHANVPQTMEFKRLVSDYTPIMEKIRSFKPAQSGVSKKITKQIVDGVVSALETRYENSITDPLSLVAD